MVISSSASILGCNRCEAGWQQQVTTGERILILSLKPKRKTFCSGITKSFGQISYEKCCFSWHHCSIPVPKLLEHVRPNSVMMDWAAELHHRWILGMRCLAFPGVVQLWSCKSLCAVDQRVRKGCCIVLRSNRKQLQKSWMHEITAVVLQNQNGRKSCISSEHWA